MIARGALVTVRRHGQQCADTTSDSRGYYFICFDRTCRAPSWPPVVLDVEASYEGLHDYYSFTCRGQDEVHDFYLRSEEENVPPDNK